MISIIIPIYNSASVLARCLNSIKSQTYSDFEVLMINDGSSDNSESICKLFAREDKRFKYIYQDNAGVSAARNNGICNINGDFFTFIDSDDWIEIEYCEKLYNEAIKNNSDVTFCGINYWTNGIKNSQTESSFNDIVQNRRIEHFLVGHKEHIIGSCWRVLFRTSTFIDVRFDENLHIYEDLTFLLTTLSLTNKMSYVQDCLYNYDLSEINYFKKYYRKNFLDICYDIGNKLYEVLNKFGYIDWAKAELFKEYCLAADWLYTVEIDKIKKFKELKTHKLTKEFCVKETYKMYKKLYTHNLKLKIKSMLLYRKQYRIFLLYRHLRNKISGNNG